MQGRERNFMEISFKRAIKIDSETNPFWNFKDTKFDSASMAVIDTIKGNVNSIYDRETSRKAGDFLRAQLGDYDKKTGVYTRRIEGNLYLFTGPDVKKAKDIEAHARKERAILEKRYEKGPDSSMSASEQVELSSQTLYKINKQNIYIRRDKALVSMTENGENGKPHSYLRFLKGPNGKINKIEYRYFYSDENGCTSKKETLEI